MAARARPASSTKNATLPGRVSNCKSYVEIGQPKAKNFGNSDKNIDIINTRYTHRVVKHLAVT